MRCEIERETFTESLNGVIGALPIRTTFPVLQNVLIEVIPHKIILIATDLDCYIRKEINLQAETKVEIGKIILPGHKLLETCRAINTEKILIMTDENNVRLQAGLGEFSFVSLDPAEYPELPEPPTGIRLEFPLATLFEFFQATNFAVSHEEARLAMCGLYWVVEEKELRMVATDGYRLALIKKPGNFKGKLSAIVPPKPFSLFPTNEDKVVVIADQTKISFNFADTVIISRLIEGPYPNYDMVIPKNQPNILRANRAYLTDALRRAALFAHPIGRLVTLELAKSRLKLFAQSEIGSAVENIECDYKGSDLKIGFNVNYLLEVLQHIESEEVIFELAGPLNAGLIKPSKITDETEKLFLLMPIHLE